MLTCLLLALAHGQDLMGLFAPAALGLFCIGHFRLFRMYRKFDPTTWAMVLLVFWLAFLTVFDGTYIDIAISDYVSHYCQMFYMAGFFMIMRLIKFNTGVEINMIRATIVSGVFWSVLSLFSFFIHPLEIMSVKFSGAGYVYGPFGAHDPMAAMVGISLVTAWVVYRDWGKYTFQRIMPKWMIMGSLGVLTLTFALARSRGYSLGLLLAFFVPVAWRTVAGVSKKNVGKQILLGFVVAMVMCTGIGFALSDRVEEAFDSASTGSSAISDDPNVETRILLWIRASGLIAQSVLTGIGPGAFEQTDLKLQPIFPVLVSRRVQGYYVDQKIAFDPEGGLHTHDTFFQMMTEWGLVGFSLTLFAFISALLAAKRAIPRFRDKVPDRGRREFMYALGIALFLYLSGSGITGGYCYMSPTDAWLFFFVIARIRAGIAHDRNALAAVTEAEGAT